MRSQPIPAAPEGRTGELFETDAEAAAPAAPHVAERARMIGARAQQALLAEALPAQPEEEIAALRAELAEARQALRESRRQFGHLVGNLAGVAYQSPLSPPWRTKFVSKGVEPLTGYRSERLEQGMAWAELIHPDDLPAVRSEIAAAIADGRSFVCEYRIIHKSGAERWVRERGRAVYSEDETPLFLEGVVLDASAEKGLELSLREAEAKAKRRAERMHAFLDSVPQMMWSHLSGGERFYSRQFREFTGVPLGEPGALERIDLVHPEDRERAAALWDECRAEGRDYEAEYRLRHHSGEYRWILSRASPQRGPGGEIAAWFGTCTDIHQRRVAEQALDVSERLNRGIIEASPDCIALLAQDGTPLFVNAAAERAFAGTETRRLAGSRWRALFPKPVRAQILDAMTEARRMRSVVRRLGQYGSPARWWDFVLAPIAGEDGDPSRIVVIARDVTEQKQAEERAQWAACHDALTGLPNRIMFQKRLDQAIEASNGEGGGFGILLLDVDDFKQINDTLGHDVGDALLCTFATRLRGALRPEDMIARLGGDEFAILLAGTEREDQVAAAVEGLLEKLSEPWFHGSRMLECRASIGASICPVHAKDRIELLKNADVALYAAKSSGRANLKLFRPEMRHGIQRRLSMLSLARDAIARRRIVPFYQPKVDLKTGAPAGFEALLRWHHPTHGVQPPSTVAAAFEDVTLAAGLSDQMIAGVIADLQRWQDCGLAVGHVAINASAAEFRRGDFAENLLDHLHRAGLPPKLVQVEVTETVFLGRGAESVSRALQLLSSAGIGIALDDFGTGFASLSHLKQFPVDFIKIDQSFVRTIEEDQDNAAIVDAVVNLGRSLGIGIIAEGVENERQHDFLSALGCDLGQGYLYGQAVPAAEVARVLDRWTAKDLSAA